MIVKFFNNRLHRILLNVPVKRYRNGGSCMLSLYEYIFTMINISISTKMNEVKLHKNDCMNKRIPDTELDYTHVILRIISLIISKGILNYTYTHIHTQNNLQIFYWYTVLVICNIIRTNFHVHSFQINDTIIFYISIHNYCNLFNF